MINTQGAGRTHSAVVAHHQAPWVHHPELHRREPTGQWNPAPVLPQYRDPPERSGLASGSEVRLTGGPSLKTRPP